jgi:hypothetical protein
MLDHGQSTRYRHQIEGHDGRLDAIQAAILSVALRRRREWNDQLGVRTVLSRAVPIDLGCDASLPALLVTRRCITHTSFESKTMVPATAAQRSCVGTGFHYPIALHLQGSV